MNRKNRKEKEQNADVSKQICVHKTQNTLLEFNSFLRMAEPKDFWHLHEDFASDYSRIRAVMVDYSKEDSISVYANLSPEIIKYVYSRIWNNVQEFKFFQQKIFCEDKNSNAVIQAFEQDCMTRRRQAGNFRNLYRMIEKLIVETEEEKDNAA